MTVTVRVAAASRERISQLAEGLPLLFHSLIAKEVWAASIVKATLITTVTGGGWFQLYAMATSTMSQCIHSV